MKTLQKAGGLGALLLAVTFVLFIISNAVIQPSLGIAGEAGADPAKLAPVASTARIVFALPILFAIAAALISLGLSDRLKERSPGLMRIAEASGLGGAVLFLAAGMFAFNLVPVAAQYAASLTTSQVALAVAVIEGLVSAAIFAIGWFVFLSSWAARRGGLPQFLSYLGLLFGASGILSFAIPPFSFIGAFVGIVWAVWLGVVLWQS